MPISRIRKHCRRASKQVVLLPWAADVVKNRHICQNNQDLPLLQGPARGPGGQ
jgi:hypothetical protein